MLPQTTITKRFGSFAMAHRQPKHAGHCRYIHGHNVFIDITFAAKELDACGFVLDFGGTECRMIKEKLAELFDHKFVVEASDPDYKNLLQGLFDLTILDSASAEHLAGVVYDHVSMLLANAGRVRVTKVVFWEDEKNSATFEVKE
jgi:6-pyruvoyltetrahydropterin/6-carboxytetrahydropterin synthase